MVKNGILVYLYIQVVAAQNESIREFQNAVNFSNTLCLWVAAN